MRFPTVAGLAAAGLVACVHAATAQSTGQYRDFKLGSDLATVSKQATGVMSDVTTVHVRPALMQELQWRRGYAADDLADPVKGILFSFYNDQLTKIVVDYDRVQTTGLTDLDLTEALSVVYGAPAKVMVKETHPRQTRQEVESGPPVATWGDSDYSVVLYRSSFMSGYRLIVTSKRLEALARVADTQAAQMDQREAPKLESARQQKEAAELREAQEKSRVTNKAAFRP